MDLFDSESAQSDATTTPAYANVPAKDRTARAGIGRTPITASFAALWDRPRVLVCLLATLIAMPLLLVGLGSGGSSKPAQEVRTAAASYRSGDIVGHAPVVPVAEKLAPTSTAAVAVEPASTSSSTSSSEPETTQAQSSTTQSTQPTAPPTTQWQPPATTVPAPVTAPPTTAPPVQAAPSSSESGQASYYDHPGGCAHKSLPFGTVVQITASNGRTASCVVNDRGPFIAGRIIDVDTSTFAQLTSLSAGVISVTISW